MARKYNKKSAYWTTKVKKGLSDSITNIIAGNATADNIQTFQVSSMSNSRNLTPNDSYILTIPVRKAVDTIASTTASSKLKAYLDGEEIIAGRLFNLINNPNDYCSQSRLIDDLVHWWLLTGEMAIELDSLVSLPITMITLDPRKLRPADNISNYESLADILNWNYITNGQIKTITSENLIFERNFNPGNNIRGISLIWAALCEIGVYYESSKYTSSFFANSAIPSHIVILPPGTPKKTRDAFINQYMSLYTSGKNAHKIAVIEGGANQVKVEQISKDLTDLNMTEIKQFSIDQIMSLFGIPPIIAGSYSKTRFDSAAEELQQYTDNTLMPLSRLISTMFQQQLINEFDWLNDPSMQTKKASLSGYTRKQLEDLKSTDKNNGRIKIVLDLESNPIVTRLKRNLISVAAEIRDSLMLSPNEAATMVGVELPPNPIRDDIWIASNMVNISKPQQIQEPVKILPENEIKQLDNIQIKKIKKEIFTLRTNLIRYIDNDERITLAIIDEICKNFNKDICFKNHTRTIYKYLKQIESLDKEEKISLLKKYFNKLSEVKYIKTNWK